MSERRSPKAGYLFPEKDSYRRAFWKAVACRLGERVRDARVLIMPSQEGAEIPVLLSLGFREQHVHAVDQNTALVATAPWRRSHPAVRAYGSALPRALQRIREAGERLDAANFDLCGCFSDSMVATLQDCAEVDVLNKDACVGLTMLKGRESTSTITALRLLNKALGHKALPCDLRVDALMREYAGPNRSVSVLTSGEYPSQTQRMVWGCFAVKRKRHGIECVEQRGATVRVIMYAHNFRHSVTLNTDDKQVGVEFADRVLPRIRALSRPTGSRSVPLDAAEMARWILSVEPTEYERAAERVFEAVRCEMGLAETRRVRQRAEWRYVA